MEKGSKNYSKATMLAAALIITGTTAIFGTYASGLNDDLPSSCASTYYEETNQTNDKQKTKIQPTDEKDNEGANIIQKYSGKKPRQI